MAPIEPPLKAAATVCGLKIAPSNKAEYAAATAVHVADSAAPGAAKKLFHACSTVVSLNAMTSAPRTRALKMARMVTTVGLPYAMAWIMTRPEPRSRSGKGRLDDAVALCATASGTVGWGTFGPATLGSGTVGSGTLALAGPCSGPAGWLPESLVIPTPQL